MKKYFPYLLIVMAIVAIVMVCSSCNPKILPLVPVPTIKVNWEAKNENLVNYYLLQFSKDQRDWNVIDSVSSGAGVYGMRIPKIPGWVRLKVVGNDTLFYSGGLLVR